MIIKKYLVLSLCCAGWLAGSGLGTAGENKAPVQADVIIYGGTPAGVMAAAAAARMGNTVALLDMNNHVGGIVSGGLTATDMGNPATVGGLSREFFDRIAKYYRDKYGEKSERYERCRNGSNFEPSVAEATFDQMIREQPGITVWKKQRFKSVTQKDTVITSVVTDDLSGAGTKEFDGRVFIDASYEGDLMAAAGVPSTYGREGRDVYGESLAGISKGPDKGKGDKNVMTFDYRVSVTPEADRRVLFPKPQNYDPTPWLNFGARVKRENLKDMGDILVNAEGRMGPNRKLDLNWGDLAGASQGYVEGSWEVREQIAQKYRDHIQSVLWYLQNDPDLPEAFRKSSQNWGLPRDEFTDTGNFPFQLYVREARRMLGEYVLTEKDLTQDRYKPDGICSGSYGVDCHGVQYIMIGKKRVVDSTPHMFVPSYDIPYRSIVPKEKPTNLLVPVCLSVSHVAYCSVRMEPVFMMLGQAAGDAAYLAIAGSTSVQKVNVTQLRDLLRRQGAIIDYNFQPQVKITWTPAHPQPGETVKFQIERGELRDPIKKMWWDFQGDGKVSSEQERPEYKFAADKVYNVDLIVEDGAGRRQLVSAQVPVGTAKATDVTLDEFAAEFTGIWDGTFSKLNRQTGAPDVFYGTGIHYLQTYPKATEPVIARFGATVPQSGKYEVCLGFRPAKHQAQALGVVIHHADGEAPVTVDQRTSDSPFYWAPLGTFRFEKDKPASVELLNHDAKGQIVVDGVRLVYQGE